MSMIRALRLAPLRQPTLQATRRHLTTSRVLRAEEPLVGTEKVEVVQPKRPIGGFRGGYDPSLKYFACTG